MGNEVVRFALSISPGLAEKNRKDGCIATHHKK